MFHSKSVLKLALLGAVFSLLHPSYAQEFPPGTPQSVIAAIKRMQAAAAAGKMPAAKDLDIVMKWSQKIQESANTPRSGATQFVPNVSTNEQITPLEGKLITTFNYTETSEGFTSKVSFSGSTRVKIYPKIAGDKNYFANIGNPGGKISSFRIEPVTANGAQVLKPHEAHEMPQISKPGDQLELAKVGTGTFSRVDTRPRSTTRYELKIENVVAAGLLTTTGTGDLLWPNLSVDGEAKGKVITTSPDGNSTDDYKEQGLPLDISMPFPKEYLTYGDMEIEKWAVNHPVPNPKITLTAFQNAVKWGAFINGGSSFSFTHNGSTFTGQGNISLQVDSGCEDEPSGPQWTTRYPDQKKLTELRPPFRDKATDFVTALRSAGATVSVGSVFRPIERSYLMHFSYDVAKGLIDPRKVPKLDEDLYNEARNEIIAKGTPAEYIPEFSGPVNICWCHGGEGAKFDLAKSKAAAEAMRAKYNIAYRPAWPRSHHNERLAMDITVSWTGTLKIKNAQGQTISIGAPRSGSSNTTLWEVGKSYGVIKHKTDAPHWSVDGG